MFRRYACIRQEDQNDCGAAALATVMAHYRMPTALQSLRDIAGTDREGTNLLGLLEAAKRLGFWAKGVEVETDVLEDVPVPAIAHVRNSQGLGHFVVVHRVMSRSVIIADPAHGIKKMPRDEFLQIWTGYLLFLSPDPSVRKPVASDVANSPWSRFLALVLAHQGVLIEACLCGVMMTMLGLSSSFFVQHLVDSVLLQGEKQLLNALGVGMLAILVMRMLFGLVRQYLLAHISRRIDMVLVSRYVRHVMELPMRFFETRRVGEILSRVNDASKIRQAISGTVLSIIIDGVTVFLAGTALWLYDTNLAMVATIFGAVLFVSVIIHHWPTRRLSRQIMEHTADLSAHLVEDVSAVQEIKTFCIEDARSEKTETKLLNVVQSTFGMQKLSMSISTVSMSATAIASILVLWHGGHRVIAGALTIGQLMFFNTLVAYLLGPLERLAGVNLQIQEALVALDRVYQVLDLPREEQDSHQKSNFAGLKHAIELQELSFQYGCREEVLHKINLKIPAGKKVAIVGESGSGKSTLLKLLMRFYDPTEGRVLLDSTDMRDVNLRSLRSKIGLVSQHPFIFNGTIRENIALGCGHASMKEIIAAARTAGLEEFVADLPDRYETIIGEQGANLSGGQCQRMAIARALLTRPDILMFDEATSHLDTATERAIQNSLNTSLADKTAILVAHRLSTIKDADLIYVLHRGQVIEQGTHDELVAVQGRYAELWRAQSGNDANTQVIFGTLGEVCECQAAR